MTNAQSKCLPILISCHEYVHPWTESCWNSAAGQILHSLGNSAKIYTIVYSLSLLMRGRIPTLRDLQNTFLGIIQSTGFLVTNGCCYLIFACILRNIFGGFYYWTIAYAPAFIASYLAILVERPTRRPLLSLYVANLATETIWRMAIARNLVKPIQYGETLIFGFGTSILLYLYKRGLNKNIAKDSLFNVLKFVVGKEEEGGYINSNVNISNEINEISNPINRQNSCDFSSNNNYNNNNSNNNNNNGDFNADDTDDGIYVDADNGDDELNRNQIEQEQEQQQQQQNDSDVEFPRQFDNIYYDIDDDQIPDNSNIRNRQMQQQHQPLNRTNYSSKNAIHKFKFISKMVQFYGEFLRIVKTMPKHKSCPHSNGCVYYSIRGGLKLFGVGITVQVALKLALQIKKILQFKLKFRKTIFNKGTLKLGLFLGGFSLLYKASSCSFRHIFGRDDPIFALPAGMIASTAFTKYPDVTIALYVLWKMLQITYNIGIKLGYLPNVPGFTILLYCASTATLFHAAALEAETVRPSYWKFLSSNSGGRLDYMDRRSFEGFGLNSHAQAQKMQEITGTANVKINFPLS